MTRLVKEDKPGKLCKKYMVGAFHEDVEEKVKDIGVKEIYMDFFINPPFFFCKRKQENKKM